MSSILIKGMEMPKDGCHHMICIYADGTVSTGGRVYTAIPVPTPHGRLADVDVLYKKALELEAEALHKAEENLNDKDYFEWWTWSSILTERSAFKYDVADAPTIIEAEH